MLLDSPLSVMHGWYWDIPLVQHFAVSSSSQPQEGPHSHQVPAQEQDSWKTHSC